MTSAILDPTGLTERPAAEGLTLASRPTTLSGVKIGLLENGKQNARLLLEDVAEVLRERYGVGEATLRRHSRPELNRDQDARSRGRLPAPPQASTSFRLLVGDGDGAFRRARREQPLGRRATLDEVVPAPEAAAQERLHRARRRRVRHPPLE